MVLTCNCKMMTNFFGKFVFEMIERIIANLGFSKMHLSINVACILSSDIYLQRCSLLFNAWNLHWLKAIFKVRHSIDIKTWMNVVDSWYVKWKWRRKKVFNFNMSIKVTLLFIKPLCDYYEVKVYCDDWHSHFFQHSMLFILQAF